MKHDQRIIEWAHQHHNNLSWIADMIGYPVQDLGAALNRDHITKDLADALFKPFKLRVAPTVLLCREDRASG
ncbi:hypothetical protein C2W62_25635 [Candidatus Entotheonella serta]|nr:hypothetical protein C2W62_25635 [Candidatus Entotheonella serta]